jgi:NADPH:quinone reductase
VSQAIQISEYGGPEVLRLVDVTVGDPGPGQVRVRHHACGINFIDVYQRTGLYQNPLPLIPGGEGAGVVEAVGEGVTHLAAGDRVAYAAPKPGAYCEARVMDALHVCKLPDEIDFETGAAMMLKGLTVNYLLRRTLPVEGLAPGDTILFHAAAGGVGLIACQWAKALGFELIGTAGSDEKCALATEYGAAHMINYRSENFVDRVKEITGGKGVKVVYDSVGKDTFDGSLKSLAKRGHMVLYGGASGPVAPVDPLALMRGGSLYLTRPTLFDYTAETADLDRAAAALFDLMGEGKLKVSIGQSFALKDAADAHRALEARQTTGSTLLIP